MLRENDSINQTLNNNFSTQHWLDANTRLSRQLKENKDIYELYFSVKFYAVDPCKLVEEITRYQFYLQLKQDILQGRVPVTFDLASQLGAYVVQCKYNPIDFFYEHSQ
jgi:band 4.1-like protein 4A